MVIPGSSSLLELEYDLAKRLVVVTINLIFCYSLLLES